MNVEEREQVMDVKPIRQIGILGTGTIGSSWATFFAAQGMKVRMHDVDPAIVERGIGKACENLEALVRYGLIEKERLAAIRGNIAPAGNMASLLDEIDYVQESVAETYEVKAKVYAEMDRLASPADDPREFFVGASDVGDPETRHPSRTLPYCPSLQPAASGAAGRTRSRPRIRIRPSWSGSNDFSRGWAKSPSF